MIYLIERVCVLGRGSDTCNVPYINLMDRPPPFIIRFICQSKLDINICKCPVSNMSNFHPLEVVDRGSETQLQVGGN